MATILKNVVQFSNLQVGIPSSVPHLLNIEGNPVQPQFIGPDAPGFTIAADATNITVTRLPAAGSGDVDVYVEYWHSIERVLPPGGLGSLLPFILGGGAQAADAAPARAFVFRPGGVPEGNVYTTWPSLMAALVTVEGQRVVEFDDSIVSPCVIPAPPVPGPYPMKDVMWSGAFTTPVAVRVVEGATFTDLRIFTFNVSVEFTGSTPPVADLGNETVLIDTGSSIQCTGTGPFFQINAMVMPVFALLVGGKFLAGATPVLDIPIPGVFAVVALGGAFAVLDTATVSGVMGSLLVIVIAESGAVAYSNVQPAFAGIIADTNFTRARVYPIPLPPSAPFTVNTVINDANQLIRCDPTAAPFSVTLPKVSLFLGQYLVIKNVSASANAITILPFAGDTIDGAVSQAIAAARGFMTFLSDGLSDWMRVA